MPRNPGNYSVKYKPYLCENTSTFYFYFFKMGPSLFNIPKSKNKGTLFYEAPSPQIHGKHCNFEFYEWLTMMKKALGLFGWKENMVWLPFPFFFFFDFECGFTNKDTDQREKKNKIWPINCSSSKNLVRWPVIYHAVNWTLYWKHGPSVFTVHPVTSHS